jgi:ketosteroid isomerase-like protein
MEPEEIVRAFGDAWSRHDLDAALALVSDACVFESTGPVPDGDRYVGKEQLRAAWSPIFDDIEARILVEETITSNDRVVQLWTYSWNGGHVRGVDVFTVRDGLVVEKLSYVKG